MIRNNYKSGFTFITFDASTNSWIVKFPKPLGTVPISKQFKLSAYQSSEEALAAAISYRQLQLSQVLTKLGFKSKAACHKAV